MALSLLTVPPSDAPSITDPANFDQEAEDWVAWQEANFVPEMNVFLTAFNLLIPDIESAAANAAIAAAAAITAVNAPGTSGTSTTSMSVGTGSKAFTTQTAKNWAVGQYVRIARTSDPAKHMEGYISAYNSGTGAMTVFVEYIDPVGGGPYTDWTISLQADSANLTATMRPASISTDTTAIAGYTYLLTATCTLTLPASPVAGDAIGFRNLSGVATPVIGRNGKKIMALSEDMTLNSVQANGVLVYVDSTQGWVLQ